MATLPELGQNESSLGAERTEAKDSPSEGDEEAKDTTVGVMKEKDHEVTMVKPDGDEINENCSTYVSNTTDLFQWRDLGFGTTVKHALLILEKCSRGSYSSLCYLGSWVVLSWRSGRIIRKLPDPLRVTLIPYFLFS